MEVALGGKWSKKKSCHNGPVEIVENLFCGSELEVIGMANHRNIDVLVPLNALDPLVWETGFRGEVLYYPIADYGTLPDDVLQKLVDIITERLKSRKSVAVFCMGGHGRTGYVAAMVLSKLGYEDPIGFVRKKYCPSAVESREQMQHIARVIGRPELAEKYSAIEFGTYDYLYGGMAYPGMGYYDYDYDEVLGGMTCGMCTDYHFCGRRANSQACEDFILNEV